MIKSTHHEKASPYEMKRREAFDLVKWRGLCQVCGSPMKFFSDSIVLFDEGLIDRLPKTLDGTVDCINCDFHYDDCEMELPEEETLEKLLKKACISQELDV